MAAQHLELRIVNKITIDAVGKPGQRMFLLQASDAIDTITLKLEKEQAQVLAYKSIELLESLEKENPDIAKEVPPTAADQSLAPPFEPLFAVGQIGLGYDTRQDRIILAVKELVPEESGEPSTAQFWISRGQLRALSNHTLTVAEQGRPICPLCEQPIDPNGHFCPKRNGHSKKLQ